MTLQIKGDQDFMNRLMVSALALYSGSHIHVMKN